MFPVVWRFFFFLNCRSGCKPWIFISSVLARFIARGVLRLLLCCEHWARRTAIQAPLHFPSVPTAHAVLSTIFFLLTCISPFPPQLCAVISYGQYISASISTSYKTRQMEGYCNLVSLQFTIPRPCGVFRWDLWYNCRVLNRKNEPTKFGGRTIGWAQPAAESQNGENSSCWTGGGLNKASWSRPGFPIVRPVWQK